MTFRCLRCGATVELPVTLDEFLNWITGTAHISTTLTSLNAEQQEFIVSGTCTPCMDKMLDQALEIMEIQAQTLDKVSNSTLD